MLRRRNFTNATVMGTYREHVMLSVPAPQAHPPARRVPANVFQFWAASEESVL